jgi:hypothetical protein
MEVRLATGHDIDAVKKIYKRARAYMRREGNCAQWGYGFPGYAKIKDDIRKGQLYVVVDGDRVHGAFAFILGLDPTYAQIDGAWLSDSPYGTIHRLGSDGEVHGVFSAAVNFAKTKIAHLRIDTHVLNKTTNHLILKEGFRYVGVIYEADHTPRNAYEFIAS